MKTLSIYLLIAISWIACQRKIENNYSLSEYRTSYYSNIYNENKMLLESHIETVSKNRYGEEKYYTKEKYFYNDSNELIKKETYEIYNDDSKLTSMSLYSHLYSKSFMFGTNPHDTLAYSYYKYNESGQIIEEYRKINFHANEEVKTNNMYDSSGRLSLSLVKNVPTGISENLVYKYKLFNDTLFTDVFVDNTLTLIKKEFTDNDTRIEISKDLLTQSTDTVYTDEEHIYSVIYNVDSKIIDIQENDSLGNLTKLEYQRWVKRID